MKPDPQKQSMLVRTLELRHGSKFNDLLTKGKLFADGVKALRNFQIVDARSPSKHVGRVIVDGVLQVGKDFEKQVRPAVNRIMQFPQASTNEGFIELLLDRPLEEISNFRKESTKNDLLSVALFFKENGVNTFDELFTWLEPEANRDKLLSNNSGLQGDVFRIADHTADYFRMLVGHWDAVAVGGGTNELLVKILHLPRVSRRWPHKEKRAIVQLAALYLCCTPRDLDASIYRYYLDKLERKRVKLLVT